MSNIIKRENIIKCEPICLEDEAFGDAAFDLEELSGITYEEPEENQMDTHTLFLNEKIEDLKEKILQETREQAEEQAQKEFSYIIEEAKIQAKALIEDAKMQAQSFKEDVEKQVFDLLNEAKSQQEQLILEGEQIKQSKIEEGELEKTHLIQQTEPEIVEILKAALDKIISHEMQYSEDWILCVVRKIMREDQVGTCLVRIHPDVLVAIEGEQIQYCTYVADDSLLTYQLILECELGQIEFDLRRGLNRIKKEMDLLLKGKVKA